MCGRNSFHPSSREASPESGCRNKKAEFPLPGHFIQLFQGDLEAFPGQLKNIVSAVIQSFSLGPLVGGKTENLIRETETRLHFFLCCEGALRVGEG